MRKYNRRLRLYRSLTAKALRAGLTHAGHGIGRIFARIADHIKAPFLRIRHVYLEQKPLMAAQKSRGKIPFFSYGQIAAALLRLVWRSVATVLNYAAPAAAFLVLVFIINGFTNQSFGLKVIYKDDVIGYIRSENEFEAAVREVTSRTVRGTRYTYNVEVPRFELVLCENPEEVDPWLQQYNRLLRRTGIEMVILDEFTQETELVNSIIRASGQEIDEAYGLYIDNQFYGAVSRKNVLLTSLRNMRDTGTTNKPNERVEFEKKIQVEQGLYLKSAIVDEIALLELLRSYETVDQIYVVQEGDSPSLIADKTGVSYQLLTEINPDIEKNLFVGDEILTAVARPFLPVKSIYTAVYQEDIAYHTEEIQNVVYARGYRELSQEGTPGIREVTAEITSINGIEIGRKELSSRVLVEPVPEKVIVGVQNVAPSSSSPNPSSTTAPPYAGSVSDSGFIWPIANGYVTATFGSYWGHTGLDIAGKVGVPIYAAASGTVTVVRRDYGGYGLHLRIEHDGGYETLYAHCSELYVTPGEYVAQGQVIAARGSTGNSSGPHLHFEIRINGSARNPQQYVSPP